MKITNIILGLVFALFAYFQLNDPDPVLWVAIYGLIAVLFLFTAFGKLPFELPIMGLIAAACIYTLIMTAPGVWEYLANQDGYTILQGMSNDKPYIEETREFGGSLLAMGALAFQYFSGRKKVART